ncbi:hypothetical protein HYW46_01345 [Candidatus Daviesbacteria bacterium]|nr:hypothetical protein [Candidatus Daviesbacteria bacterium]
MTQAEREVSAEECPYRDEETAFVAGIDPSLLRDAVSTRVDEKALLKVMLVPLGGALRRHLDMVPPRDCFFRMARFLARRMEKYSGCFAWNHLLGSAATPPGINISCNEGHLARCPYCQRDVRQLRDKLPNYREFYI